MKKYFLILFFISLSLLKSNAQDSTIVLTSNHSWEFLYLKSISDSVWLPASNDLNIYSCLVFNKIISAPYFSSNSDSMEWVQHREWKFRTHFSIPENVLSKTFLTLRFYGLDTYAKIYLNGQCYRSTDNFFLNWDLDVKKFLKTENELVIQFLPVKETSDNYRKEYPYTFPGSEYVFTRKPAFQFGWDFAPKLLPCGITKAIELIYSDDFYFNTFWLEETSLNDSLAILDATFFYDYKSELSNEELPVSFVNLQVTDTVTHEHLIDTSFYLTQDHIEKFYVQIKNPKRWWCNGYGEPFLYHLKFEIRKKDGTILFSSLKNYGAKTIELVQTPDSVGSSFYFKLNGVPVFIKGANFIPSDALMRERFMIEKNHQLILDAKSAHMNMLRVWGGGEYANEKFLNDCDENGIMVWQDFPFACAMYPADHDFMLGISDEASENVRRMKSHACLTIWCGNNEILEGWNNWGWQKQYNYSQTDSAEIREAYESIFNRLLNGISGNLFSTDAIPYWPSSPSIGWGHKESLQQGDVHYWGVWWGMEPFNSYINHTGRFVSEYGFQSFPSMNCLQQYLKPNELYLYSPALKTHQKHPIGFETIQTYLKRDYDTTTNFENHVYLSQLLQAKGMSIAIEAHRRAMPYCMGTIYWQLNDCWPAISWSSIDFAGNKKAFHYQLNRLYNTYLLSMVKNKNGIEYWIVSDSLKNTTAELQLSLWNFSGKLLWSKNVAVNIPALSSKIYFQLALDSILKKYDSTEIVLHSKLIQGDKMISSADYFFASPKNLNLQNPEIKFKVTTDEKYKMPRTISVSCSKPAFGVSFYAQRNDGKYLGFDLSDNFFSIFPDEYKEINMKSMSAYSGNGEDFVNCKVSMKCLNEVK